jgi:hypothetical protein
MVGDAFFAILRRRRNPPNVPREIACIVWHPSGVQVVFSLNRGYRPGAPGLNPRLIAVTPVGVSAFAMPVNHYHFATWSRSSVHICRAMRPPMPVPK